MLTYLALAVARGSVRRDTLVAIFWPELDAEHARGALSQALRFLRRELGDDIFSGRGRGKVELDAHRVWCDVTAFEGACREGDHARAVELYRGDLLEGLHAGDAVDLEQWLDGERDRLARLYADALTASADAFVRRGDAPGAIACLRRLVERDPYNATVAVKYMQALVSVGDRAGAIAHASVHAQRLTADLEALPDPMVAEFAERLRQAPEPRGAPPPDTIAAEERRHATTDTATGSIERRTMAVTAAASASSPRRWIRASALVAAVSFAGLFVATVIHQSPRVSSSRRIVVATFDNFTGDTTLNSLGVMVADWITEGLQRTGLVDVVPSATMLLSSSPDIAHDASSESVEAVRKVGRNTGARYVVSGAIYDAGGKLRLQPRVTDVQSLRLVGSPSPVVVSRGEQMAGIDQLRQHVLATIAVAIDPRVASWAEKASNPPSLAAFSEFTEGMDLFLRRNQPAQAIPHFRRAADADSGYVVPLLWEIQASTWFESHSRHRLDSLFRVVERSRGGLTRIDGLLLDRLEAIHRNDLEAAYRASHELVSVVPGSHFVQMLAVDAARTNRAREAVDVMSRLDAGRRWVAEWQQYWTEFAYALHALGEYDRELDVARQARALQPDNARFMWIEAQALVALGRLDEVRQLIDCCLLPPSQMTSTPTGWARNVALELRAHGHSELARTVLQRSLKWFEARLSLEERLPELRYQRMLVLEALERWREAGALADTVRREVAFALFAHKVIGNAAAVLGDSTRARGELALLLATPDTSSDFPQALLRAAEVAASLGEHERAISLLEGALARGAPFNFWLHLTPAFEPLRQRPDYREVMKLRN